MGETWVLPISSRVASAEICRIFPAGRSAKQSGWCSGGKCFEVGDSFRSRSEMACATIVSVSRSSPCNRRLCASRSRWSAFSITVTAGVPASDSGQETMDIGSGRSGQRNPGGRQTPIRLFTSAQMSLRIAFSGSVPSTTKNRLGSERASTR